MVTAEPRLEHQTVKVKQLIDDYRFGRVVIPEFQRDYVWKKSKAPKLIDSLYRGFPISSLLLWQSAEETRSRRRFEPSTLWLFATLRSSVRFPTNSTNRRLTY